MPISLVNIMWPIPRSKTQNTRMRNSLYQVILCCYLFLCCTVDVPGSASIFFSLLQGYPLNRVVFHVVAFNVLDVVWDFDVIDSASKSCPQLQWAKPSQLTAEVFLFLMSSCIRSEQDNCLYMLLHMEREDLLPKILVSLTHGWVLHRHFSFEQLFLYFSLSALAAA